MQQMEKKVSFGFLPRKDLAKAACIHATAQMEADSIRKLGFKNPVAVIPTN
jgi:hypothetical protein